MQGIIKKKHWRKIVGSLLILIAIALAIGDYRLHQHDAIVVTEPQPSEKDNSSTLLLSGNDQHAENYVADEEPAAIDETLTVQNGDTLTTVLARADIDSTQATEILEQLCKVFNPKDLRPQHEIYIQYQTVRSNDNKRYIQSLILRPSIDLEIHVIRNENDKFRAYQEKIQLNHSMRFAKGSIANSLYIDAGKQFVPPKILHELIQAFSYDVDFQRGFHVGDQFGLMYDMHADPQSLREKSGRLHFAMLQLQDKLYQIYLFKNSGGHYGFYNEKGESVRKGLLRTPIDGARISSPFGNRRHPILGFTKMHKGIDFAAPSGTPIMAAGDGVIVKAEFLSSYGRYIKIKHNHEFSTAYAHMSRFAKGINTGSRVRQGQVIGYVGASGRTTGPHLHYELLRDSEQINPNSIKMLPAGKLNGSELSEFKSKMAQINKAFKNYKPVVDSIAQDEELKSSNDSNSEPNTLQQPKTEPIDVSDNKPTTIIKDDIARKVNSVDQ